MIDKNKILNTLSLLKILIHNCKTINRTNNIIEVLQNIEKLGELMHERNLEINGVRVSFMYLIDKLIKEYLEGSNSNE